ncbi:hypothetical protein J41TS12_21920 [Paenibacillus antibioticophila]|uniref:NodB homology domain-containing protein n=1 Tax=Paenibacillus antibioticophila TaxID=1274374 RepID=A0A920CES6_9BACL|nr:polysaccharide deacetylase family protein [Paenibacillus antibioticophila]GIO37331.1 hypothetical protein J41TS12_21920 [Paenibacillus antibioticophila]
MRSERIRIRMFKLLIISAVCIGLSIEPSATLAERQMKQPSSTIQDQESTARQAQTAVRQHRPKSLSELRRSYSETFKFKGPEVKQIALTFDDVPDPRFTPQILEALSQQGVRATFFVVGHRVKKHPDLLRRIHHEGHVIGNHSYSHPQFSNKSVIQFQKEIQRTEEAIFELIGYRPRLIRPPYGEITENQVRWAKQHGYKLVNWNVDSLDWKGIHKEKVKQNVLNAAGPGSIILMHGGGGTGSNLAGSIEALPDIIHELQAKGYQFVTLPQLLDVSESK